MGIYYRPKWTCGRYNASKRVALMYNLLEGMCYFFEEMSAEIVNIILNAPKDSEINVAPIINRIPLDTSEITIFLDHLQSIGLLTSNIPTNEDVRNYRKQILTLNHQQENVIQRIDTTSPMELDDAEMAYAEAIGGNIVANVMFELTYSCSEKCIHCYNPGATRNDSEEDTRKSRKELSLDDYKRIIDELCDLGLYKVCLSGGDPFSKNIVWEVIDYLYQKEIAFDIYTNGQSILYDIKKLAGYYPRLVGLSLYSGISEIHDSITRIKGSHKKSVAVMEQLSSFAIPMLLKCCIMRPNLKSYFTVKEIAKRYNAIPQFELNITDSLEGDKCASQQLRLTAEMMEVVLRDKDIASYVGLEAINDGASQRTLDNRVCDAGNRSFCITPEGNLQPCCAFPYSFGNLKEHTLSYLIQNNQDIHWLNKQTLRTFDECGTHDYCTHCQICIGNNYNAHGTPLKASENNCFLAKVRYNLAGKIKHGYDPLYGKSLQDRLQDFDIVLAPLQREGSINYRNPQKKLNG